MSSTSNRAKSAGDRRQFLFLPLAYIHQYFLIKNSCTQGFQLTSTKTDIRGIMENEMDTGCSLKPTGGIKG
ncbi:hypothetical protein B9L23_02110 [Parageobacillus galactosidasius]|uniref:Uncharacterized protein n=1 Tax=Parageobacillus galactosidasius TaxID=883812 RepID=A0A226QPD2_9BACL|nr:hypothetical protein B9L23_02110 [Parageobacillus galactosidasius]